MPTSSSLVSKRRLSFKSFRNTVYKTQRVFYKYSPATSETVTLALDTSLSNNIWLVPSPKSSHHDSIQWKWPNSGGILLVPPPTALAVFPPIPIHIFCASSWLCILSWDTSPNPNAVVSFRFPWVFIYVGIREDNKCVSRYMRPTAASHGSTGLKGVFH